jgi:hypothetical protein
MKDDREHEVEQQPVEPERDLARLDGLSMHVPSAQRERRQGEQHPDGAHALAPPEREGREAEAE